MYLVFLTFSAYQPGNITNEQLKCDKVHFLSYFQYDLYVVAYKAGIDVVKVDLCCIQIPTLMHFQALSLGLNLIVLGFLS